MTPARGRPEYPEVKRVPTTRVHHGQTFVDDFEWLRDADDPEVIAYLDAQNALTDALTADLAPLAAEIFGEIKARTKETDMSVPVRRGGYWSFVRTAEGQEYSRRCRVPIAAPDDWTPPTVSADTPLPGEQVLLDGNIEAQGHDFYSLGALAVSEDGTRLAYGADVTGDERYTLQIRDIATGEHIGGELTGLAPGAVWSRDGRYVFYQRVDDAWRPHEVWRHEVGTDGTGDVLVLTEPDERFWVTIGSTRSRRYIVAHIGSKDTAEVRVLDADDPTGEFRTVSPRREGVDYHVEHVVIGDEDRFLVLHNDGAVNFELASAPVDDPSALTTLVPHRPDVRLEDVDAFAGHVVLGYREGGLPRLAVAQMAPAESSTEDTAPSGAGLGPFVPVEFDEELFSVGLGKNPDFSAPRLRVVYESFVTPPRLLEIDVATGERTLLKATEVLGDYDPAEYVASRDWAVAADGTRVPVSIVRRRDTALPAPTLLYGYGSYETSLDPGFSVSRLSLLDRGVVFAIAHVRGGGELGRTWYEQGRLAAKPNTFTDFVTVARRLKEAGVAGPIVGSGGSAGGLLIGAVANLAPELFAGLQAVVPFVDPLTSMLDPSLPLTVVEWEEWGNPLADSAAYDVMAGYAPYENVTERAYPPIIALASLHDTRVMFTEAAKWVAQLQRSTTSDAPVLLKTEMKAGHGGVSGRYASWREIAFEHAWVLGTLGLAG